MSDVAATSIELPRDSGAPTQRNVERSTRPTVPRQSAVGLDWAARDHAACRVPEVQPALGSGGSGKDLATLCNAPNGPKACVFDEVYYTHGRMEPVSPRRRTKCHKQRPRLRRASAVGQVDDRARRMDRR